jgi:hypothetical protein
VSNMLPMSMLVAAATLTLSAPISAQGRSTISSSALDAAVAARPASNRAVVASALSSSQAVAAAGRLGMSSDQLKARIAALDDASAQQLADRILAGGRANLVISTTAIIIILLVLILLTH